MTFNENYEKFDEKFGKTNLLTNMRVAKIYVEQRRVILFHVYFLKKNSKILAVLSIGQDKKSNLFRNIDF